MAELIDRTNLQRVVAVINGKGGVGKTTLTANMGGLLAASGWKVLLVDLDPQGNLGFDLGYFDSAGDDRGMSLGKALQYPDDPPRPLRDVRPNLDVLVGGALLEGASAALLSLASRGFLDQARLSIAKMLSSIAGEYDIVLLDCPPLDDTIQTAAIAAARYIFIPTKSDGASMHGLKITEQRLIKVLPLNPDVDLLGVVLFDSGASSTAIRRNFNLQVMEILGGVASDKSVFESFVRHSEATATSVRGPKGLLAHELEDKVKNGPKWYEALKLGIKSKPLGPAAAQSVAESLQAVTNELIDRIEKKEAEAGEKTNV